MFEVGEQYENRKGEYTVQEIRGPKMMVQYQDGSVAELNISIQERIWENIVADREVSTIRASRQAKGQSGLCLIKTIAPAFFEDLSLPTWKEHVTVSDELYKKIKSGDRIVYFLTEKQQFFALGTVTGDPEPPKAKDHLYRKQTDEEVYVFPIDFDIQLINLELAVELQAVDFEHPAQIKSLLNEEDTFILISEDDFDLLTDLLTEAAEEHDDEDIDDDEDEDYED